MKSIKALAQRVAVLNAAGQCALDSEMLKALTALGDNAEAIMMLCAAPAASTITLSATPPDINPIDDKRFTTQDADRLLGMADQFLEDWEQNEGHPSRRDDPIDGEEARECAERREEYDAIRPLLVAAPDLYAALLWAARVIESVAFVSKEGDTDKLLETIAAVLAKVTA